MIKIFSSILLSSLLLCCHVHNSQNDKSPAASDTSDQILPKKAVPLSLDTNALYKFGKDSVTIVPFVIGIALSPKAVAAITRGRETIIVSVSFTGTPKDSSLIPSEGDGSFIVAAAEKEISYGEVAQFDRVNFSRKLYDQLADKDVNMDVNVFTGRKSSPDNLLDCEFLSDKISHIVNKKIMLTGKLIYGDDSTQRK